MKFSLTLLCLLGSLAVCQADAVRLQIKGPDGKPIAGAKVRVLASRGSWYKSDFLPARDFSSDAEGNIAFESHGTPATTAIDAVKPSLWARVMAPTFAVGAIQLKAGNNSLSLGVGRLLEGVTLDSQQKPVANVRLVLEAIQDGSNKLMPLRGALSLETRTDAQGHWRFESLPPVGRAQLRVQDARFKGRLFGLDLSQKTPPLFLEPGSVIKGRLLRPDGTPAPGVSIFAGDPQRLTTTDANGRFEVIGLDRENVYLQGGTNSGLPIMIVPRQISNLQVGEVRDIGDWKTLKGIRVTGRVVSLKSGKPIAGAAVSAWGKSMVIREQQSDKNGAFDFMVSPDSDLLSIRPAGYLDFSRRGLPAPQNGVIALGKLDLQSAYRATGVVVDETGAPVKNISLYAEKDRSMIRDYAYTDSKTGAFSLERLHEGDHTIKVEGFKSVSAVKFTAGTGATPSLRVVVQGKAGSDQMMALKAVGRVEDGDGNPVAGALVDVQFSDTNRPISTESAVSQSDGTVECVSSFVSPHMTANVSHIYRPGYMRLQQGVEPEGNTYRIKATMLKRGNVLRGRIVDSAGKSIENAFVALQNNEAVPISADSEGAFTLSDVPAAGVTLLASNGPSFATFKVEKAGQDINIVLPDAPAAIDKSAVADELLENAQLGYGWKSVAAIISAERLHALMMKRADVWTRDQYLDYLAHHNARLFLSSENELRTTTSDPLQHQFEYWLMLARASSGNAAQKTQVRSWLKGEEQTRRDISVETVQVLLRLAEVAARLDAKEGAMWLDYALQLNDQLGIKSAGKSSEAWGRIAARISATAPRAISENWDTTGQLQLLSSAIATWREDGNVEAARASWPTIEALAADLAKNPVPRMRGGDFGAQPSELLHQARADYALLLAAANSNPKYRGQNFSSAAYKVAMSMMSPKYPDYTMSLKQEVLVSVAQSAMRQKEFALINTLLAPVLSLRTSGSTVQATAVLANAAAIAEGVDKSYAAKFWTSSYAIARPDAEESNLSSCPTIAAYAKACGDKWPGQSRILIEREWAQRLQGSLKPRSTDDEDGLTYDQSTLSQLTEAMVKLAPTRALEMLDSVPEKENLRAQTRTKIAVTLLKK
ncbi:hypothetical protein EON83_22890 [bacterium]|nr:MAG: hypothetical protein EON83_22890 [bacterium]